MLPSHGIRIGRAALVRRNLMVAPCEKMELMKKGPWTPEEDKILVSYIQRYGHGNWRSLPNQAGLLRCGKSCRLRWTNYLRPDIKRGNFTCEEEEAIIKLHELLGNKWSAIAARLPGRTDNEIKNVWHTHLKKRLKQKVSNTSETQKHVFEENPPSQLSNSTNSPQLSPHQYSSHAPSIHSTASKSSTESDDGMWSDILSSDAIELDSMSIEYCSRPPKLQPYSGETMEFWYNEFMELPNLTELPSLDSIILDSLLGSANC